MVNAQHETIEEEFFWPMVRKHLPDGEALAETGADQEPAAKRLPDAVRTTKPNQADYEQMVGQPLDDLRGHPLRAGGGLAEGARARR